MLYLVTVNISKPWVWLVYSRDMVVGLEPWVLSCYTKSKWIRAGQIDSSTESGCSGWFIFMTDLALAGRGLSW